MTIEIIKDEAISTAKTEFFFVKVNGDILLECMSAEEVEALTIKEITELWRNPL